MNVSFYLFYFKYFFYPGNFLINISQKRVVGKISQGRGRDRGGRGSSYTDAIQTKGSSTDAHQKYQKNNQSKNTVDEDDAGVDDDYFTGDYYDDEVDVVL